MYIAIFNRGPSIDVSYQVPVYLAKWFQRRRLKCEKLTDDRKPSEGKSSHCLWHCELKLKPLNLLVVPDFVSMFGVFSVFCLVLKSMCLLEIKLQLWYLDFLSSMILLIVLIFVYLLFTLFRFYIYTDKNESTSSMQFYCCKCSTP
jgi:uncharacterized membrane protein